MGRTRNGRISTPVVWIARRSVAVGKWSRVTTARMSWSEVADWSTAERTGSIAPVETSGAGLILGSGSRLPNWAAANPVSAKSVAVAMATERVRTVGVLV